MQIFWGIRLVCQEQRNLKKTEFAYLMNICTDAVYEMKFSFCRSPFKGIILLVVALTLILLYIACKRVLYPAKVFQPWSCESTTLATKWIGKGEGRTCLDNGTKLILFYNTWFRGKPWWGIDSNESFFADCPSNKCRISYDVNDIGQSDVAIFHFGHTVDTPKWQEIEQIHKYRCPHQRMAVLTQESLLHPDIADISFIPHGFFNWTLTFKRTSDFPIPYGHYFPLLIPQRVHVNYAQGKDKLVAWAVSNCGKTREKYVKELVKHINVDIYGKCSSVYGQHKKCPPSGVSQCDERLRTYKFYLAFENAACTDYVTEKFWRTLDWKVVPIVLAKDIYSPVAPPGSFISVQDFPSVKALAKYLLYLDKNDTAYNEYFHWRQKFGSHKKHMPQFACDICEALHDNCLQPKVYHDMTTFWNRSADCEEKELSLLKLIKASSKDQWGWSSRLS